MKYFKHALDLLLIYSWPSAGLTSPTDDCYHFKNNVNFTSDSFSMCSYVWSTECLCRACLSNVPFKQSNHDGYSWHCKKGHCIIGHCTCYYKHVTCPLSWLARQQKIYMSKFSSTVDPCSNPVHQSSPVTPFIGWVLVFRYGGRLT